MQQSYFSVLSPIMVYNIASLINCTVIDWPQNWMTTHSLFCERTIDYCCVCPTSGFLFLWFQISLRPLIWFIAILLLLLFYCDVTLIKKDSARIEPIFVILSCIESRVRSLDRLYSPLSYSRFCKSFQGVFCCSSSLFIWRVLQLYSNLNGSNIFGTMEIRSRHG